MSTEEKTPIQFDYYCATILNDILKRDIRVFDPNYCLFSYDELSTIKTITLSGVDSIDWLPMLPALEGIYIKNFDYRCVTPEGNYDNRFFNHISTEELNDTLRKLPNLKELFIENDLNITYVDLSYNPELTTLFLQNNPELGAVYGLSNLHKLKNVTIYGNNIIEAEEFGSYIHNTLDAEVNLVDLGVLFAAIKDQPTPEDKMDFLEYLDLLNFKGLFNLTFTEKNGLNKYNLISLAEIKHLVKNYVKLYKRQDLFEKDDETKINYVLKYIKNNIAFNKDGILERAEFVKSYGNEQGIVPDWGEKHMSYLHNSFSTFKLKRGNCEGIVNLMRIMLSILDIETEDVQCHDKRSPVGSGTNHAILRAKVNGKWFYFDPAFDKTEPGNYEYMTFEDTEKYLTLCLYEKQKVLGVVKNEGEQLHIRYN